MQTLLLALPTLLFFHCFGQNVVGNSKLFYTLSPNFIIIPHEYTLSQITNSIQGSGFNITSTGNTSGQVQNFLSSGCTFSVKSHAENGINTSQLMRLFNASLADTDLLCYAPAHRIHAMFVDTHTMLNTHFKLQIQQSNNLQSGSSFMEYSITCPELANKGNDRAEVRSEKDCEWCRMIISEFERVGELPTLGKLLAEMGLVLGTVECEGCEAIRPM
jgi:hypothetical protein